jgi:thiol-disulfide isomerase/thioredoxin
MKYLSLLSLLPLFIGCGASHNTTVMPEFSVRDSLKTSVITVEVPGFDEAMDPIGATAFWYAWHSQDQESHQLFFDADGRSSFEVSENIVRSYGLIYDKSFFEFVARPGEDLTLQFLRDTVNAGYQLRAPNAPFTDQAIEIVTALAPPDWPTRDSLSKGITDLDSLFAFNEDIAEQRRRRLADLWASGKYTDPMLLEYANSYINHQVRYDLNFQVMDADKSLNPDSLARRYLMPNAGKPFADPIISSSELISDLRYEQMAITGMAYRATKHLPKAERKAARYAHSAQLIDSLYEGYLRDVFLTLIYNQQLPVENPAPILITDAERFVRTTPYPSLSGPLRKKLSIRAGEVNPVNLYEQQLPNIPEGIDNPIPDILAAHAGKVVVLDFWATWCSPCIDEMKNDYPAFMEKYDPEQIAVVFLAQSSPENIWRDQVSKLEFSAIHLQTNKEQTSVVSKLFGISGIPHHAIFDQRGKLVKAKTDGPGYGLAGEVDKLLRR